MLAGIHGPMTMAGLKEMFSLQVMKIVSQVQEVEELEMRAETSPELMQFVMRIGT